MATHTQGPWLLWLSHDARPHQVVGPASWRTGLVSVLTDVNHYAPHIEGYDAEQSANARLIASAPELLEALKNITGWMEVQEHLHGEFKGGAKRSIEDANSAIRKATEAAS